ncbi:hypothetical protein R9C00_01795 [Flammeovirgaceae bacterium SG7u.111]|nr:hypothetical protein [Flammeovirgaceae bacterium SG7u.132]WPO36175.1 hypothetical protein R9C00_01795 [Flammeovirgaceae bacterium SG7u.111]
MHDNIQLHPEQEEEIKLLVFQGRKMEAIAKIIEWTGVSHIIAEAYISQFISIA